MGRPVLSEVVFPVSNVRVRRVVAGWVVAAVVATILWSATRDGREAAAGPASDVDGLASAVVEYPPSRRGEPVEVAGTTLTGEPLDTTSYRGRVVVLNVWGSWCAPCREEAPVLARVPQEFPESKVSVIGINVRDNRAAALAFERRFSIAYPSISDEDNPQVLLALRGYVPLTAVPVTVLLDRDGRVGARVIGVLREATLRALLTNLVGEVQPPVSAKARNS